MRRCGSSSPRTPSRWTRSSQDLLPESLTRRYAERRGYEIVHAYKDGGKSGLNLEGRQGLQRLLGDIENGRAILSLRWSRGEIIASSFFSFLVGVGRGAGFNILCEVMPALLLEPLLEAVAGRRHLGFCHEWCLHMSTTSFACPGGEA